MSEIQIGRIYIDRGQISVAGDVEAIFEKPLPVDMEQYRTRFRDLCKKFDDLAYICHEIVKSSGCNV